MNKEITRLSLLPIFDIDIEKQYKQVSKVIMPILRRVMPTVIANEIIGVQPMIGPASQISTLRVRYADGPAPQIHTLRNNDLSPHQESKIKKSWFRKIIEKIRKWLWK